MSTTTPRFARTSPRGHEHGLDAPLPSTLAELTRERVEQHKRVATRLAELRARRVELARQLAEQEAADERAATEAALAGKTPGRRQKAASLRGKLEEAESEVASFENALARSADSLLTAAAPHVAEATEKAAAGKQAALGRARELLAALDAALEEAGNLTAERLWLGRLDGRTRIEPYRAVAADPGLGQLRRRLQDAYMEWQVRDEERRAEAERQRRWREEHEAEWARQKEQAEREDRERRVRYEGMRLTHRGGRPVGPAGNVQESEEEPRP
jgi:hypothetical protein